MNKKIRYLILLAFLSGAMFNNFIVNTYARYVTAFNKTISIDIREPNYIIKYNSNGGTGTMENQTFTYNTEDKLNKNLFKKYGFNFMGWNTLSDGSGTHYDNENEIYNLSSNDGEEFELFAQWEKNINIRIEDATLLNSSNGGATNISFDYKNTTLSNIKSTVNLNNANAYVTFDIDITNYLNRKMGIYSITGLPSNLEYEIVNNYNIKDKLCDESPDNSGKDAKIQLRIKYKNGGYVSNNTTYNLDLDILFKKVYSITYENIYSANNYPSDVVLANYFDNSGSAFDINSVVYPSYIMEDESETIDFYPHIPNYVSVTNTVTYSYEKPTINLSNPKGDIVIKNLTKGDIVMYDHPTSVNFTGNNNINTRIQLFSSANYKRNFRIEFTIDSRGGTQVDKATLFSVMNESGSPWPGVLFRIQNNQYHVEANGGENGNPQNYAYNNVSSVKIEKIDGIVTASVNGGNPVTISNFKNYTSTFNIPVTFGSSMQNSTTAFRYYSGALSKMKITYLDDENKKDDPIVNSNEKWALVESPNDITTDGTYIIGYNNESTDQNSKYMGVDDYNNIISGEIELSEVDNNGEYTYYKTNDATDNYRWIFDTDTTGGKIKNVSNNRYIYFNSGSLVTASSSQTTTTMDWNSDGYWLIHATTGGKNYYLKYNDSENFSIGTDGNNRSMKIYKLVVEEEPEDDGWEVVYEHKEAYTFTGRNNLNTNIRLFSTENYDKDFEVTLTVDEHRSSNNSTNMETLFNSMDETGNNFPGVALRLQNDTQTNNIFSYFLTADMDAEYHTYPVTQSNPNNVLKTVTISRIDGKLYYKINDQEAIEIYDFVANKTPKFNTVATFGSSTNNTGVYRGFTGVLSNMVIRMRDKNN